MKSNHLFILAPPKTGTSTLMGILNCDDHIFMLYETLLYNTKISKYGSQFLNTYPNSRFLFQQNEKIDELYTQLYEYLRINDHIYKYIGDKIVTLDSDQLSRFSHAKVIITIRDIKSWLCKKAIREWYLINSDIVTLAIDYCIYILNSFLFSNVLRINTDDIILHNDQVVHELSNFLELNLKDSSKYWWDKIGKFENSNPKNAQKWWRDHYSAKIKPATLDTTSNISNHPFWQELLPIFDKYFHNLNSKFSEISILEDIDKIRRLIKFSPLSLTEAYENFDTESYSVTKEPLFARRRLKSYLINSLNYLRAIKYER